MPTAEVLPSGPPATSAAAPDRRALHRERTAEAIEHAALELFGHRAFDAVTVDDLAAAAGVGRRTFFRYFETKNDVVLGALDAQLARLRAELARHGPQVPPLAAAHRSFLLANSYPAAELPLLRQRMQLLGTVPVLEARAAARYRTWEQVLAEDAAARLGVPVTALLPQLLAHSVIAAMRAVFATWLHQPDADLPELITRSFGQLAHGLEPHGTF